MIEINWRHGQQLVAAGPLIERLGLRRKQIIEHYLREIHAVDGHAAGTLGDGGSPSTSNDSSVERAIEALEQLDLDMADIQAGEHLILVTLADLGVSYDRVLGSRIPRINPDDHGTRCKAHDCDQWAAPQRLPLTGTETSSLWCNDHWLSACQICGDHQHEGRRVEGVYACEAAYRRHLRASSREPAA